MQDSSMNDNGPEIDRDIESLLDFPPAEREILISKYVDRITGEDTTW